MQHIESCIQIAVNLMTTFWAYIKPLLDRHLLLMPAVTAQLGGREVAVYLEALLCFIGELTKDLGHAGALDVTPGCLSLRVLLRFHPLDV